MSTPKTDNSNERESAAQMLAKADKDGQTIKLLTIGAKRHMEKTLFPGVTDSHIAHMLGHLLVLATNGNPNEERFAERETHRLIELGKGD